jgi:hypothetical protein
MQAAATQNSTRPGEAATARSGSVSQAFDDARLAWDTLSFAWDTRVMSFDLDTQGEFLTQLRINDWSGGFLLLCITAIVATVLAFYAAWLRWRARPRPDALRALYDQFCLKAARLGAPRLASEGPANYAVRAANLIPQQADRIQRITESYIALRYSPRPASTLRDNLAAEVRAFGNARG